MPGSGVTDSFLAAAGASGISTSQIALLLFVVALTTMMLLATRRKIREAQNAPRTYAREQYRRLQEEKVTADNVQEVMVQLEQLARQIHGQIDTKFAKLEAVIRDADTRIETLTGLLRARKNAPAVEAASCGTGILPVKQSPGAGEADNDVAATVYRLADVGLTSTDIARQTAHPVGEVELILSLRKARDRATAPKPTPDNAAPQPVKQA